MFSMHNYAEFYDAYYQNYYRWEHRAPEKNVLTDKVDFDRGDRLVLCIMDLVGEWQDWICIATSHYSGLGVFTAREFPKGGLLGMYMGPQVWRADTVGTPEPSAELLKQHGVLDQLCNCCVRTGEGRMVVVSPQRVEPTADPRPLYLGMHYAKGSEEEGVPHGKVNCEIIEDGGVFAHRPLKPNEELVVGVLE